MAQSSRNPTAHRGPNWERALANTGLYRQVALDKLSSPDQLDRAIQVVSPKGWLALASAGLLIVAAVVWSYTAKIPDRVTNTAVIVAPNSTREIFAEDPGHLRSVAVKVGDHVSAGQAVARVAPTSANGTEEPVTISAPVTGTVVEVLSSVGDAVSPEQPLITMQLDVEASDLHVVAYLSPLEVGPLRKDMPVQISPVTADEEVYGSLMGRVDLVSAFPVSHQAVATSVQNEDLAQVLVQEAGDLPVLVRIELDRADTPTGFRWSNGDGPPGPLADNTLSQVAIIVGETRPITSVFPFIK